MGEGTSIGRTLRQRREERGLTPEQAAFQSRVPLRLLQALEADDYRLLPDPAYLIRLLHEYACLLNLEPVTLEAEFRRAIRRPPGTSLVAVPLPSPPPVVPWRQIFWTAMAILVVTPLVFIALSLTSKRTAERSEPPRVAEQSTEELAPAGGPAQGEGEDAGLAERLLARQSGAREPGAAPSTGETAAPSRGSTESISRVASLPSGDGASRPSPPEERKFRRHLLTARALEATWMAVRADGGQERQVLLQKGQSVRFAADTGFVITVGNAGGVALILNGVSMPLLGTSGQVIRDLVLPPVRRDPDSDGAPTAGESRATPE